MNGSDDLRQVVIGAAAWAAGIPASRDTDKLIAFRSKVDRLWSHLGGAPFDWSELEKAGWAKDAPA